MTLAIFVEGQSDRLTIPILIQKLGHTARIPHVVPQGRMFDVERMSSHIRAVIRAQRRVDRILIFTDSEGVAPQETLLRTEPLSEQLNRVARGVSVDYVIVDHSLEGWLACDVDALRAVLGANARIRIRGNPEDNPRPAELLARVFQHNGKTFRKTADNPRIADHVTPDHISAKSPTFSRLVSMLGGVA